MNMRRKSMRKVKYADPYEWGDHDDVDDDDDDDDDGDDDIDEDYHDDLNGCWICLLCV